MGKTVAEMTAKEREGKYSMRFKIFLSFLLLFIVLPSASAQQARQTYDVVVSGMECRQNLQGDRECNYHVGRSLHFGIAGVGQKDPSIYFYEASMKGDYFALFASSHGCVVVKPGLALPELQRLDLAFVSPKNGRVYQTWETCAEAQ